MGFFSNKEFKSLEDLFFEQIADLYDAEIRLTKAVPKMSQSSKLPSLKEAFTKHLRETEGQIKRLERIFKMLEREPRRESCEGIKGLISEGSEMMSADGDEITRDAAIISAAQRVEHYEMAGYGTARSLAEHLGHDQAVQLLQATLEEEMAADKKLTEIAERSIYAKKFQTAGKSSAKTAAKKPNARTAHSGNGRSTDRRRAISRTKAKSRSSNRSASSQSRKRKSLAK